MVVVFWQGFGGLGVLPLVLFPLIAFVPPAVARTGNDWPFALALLITGVVGAVFCVMVDRRLAPGRTRMTVDPQTRQEVQYRRKDTLFFIPLKWVAIPYGLVALFGVLGVLVTAFPGPSS